MKTTLTSSLSIVSLVDRCPRMPMTQLSSSQRKNRFQAHDRVSVIIDRVKNFLASNSLALNLGKTEIVECMVRQKRVHTRGSVKQITIQKPDGSLKVITAKDSCRLLGGNINLDANRKHHLNLGEKPLMKNLRSILGVLTHLSPNLPMKSRLLLANGLFFSRLLYLLPVWGGIPQREANRIQRLINKCARVVLGKGRKTRTRALLVGCDWFYF